jgi:AraC family transcriptional regulator, ethanolamine operon transcriptional activator
MTQSANSLSSTANRSSRVSYIVISLKYQEVDEFESALRGMQGYYVLRSKEIRKWRLTITELQGVSLTLACEGAANIYAGASSVDCFNLQIPLTGHEALTLDGHRFSRREVGWQVPGRMFCFDARTSRYWLAVAISRELVLTWIAMHEDYVPVPDVNRTLSIDRVHLARLLHLARRLFRMDSERPADLHRAAARHAATLEITDAVLRLALPSHDEKHVGRPACSRPYVIQRALGFIESAGDMAIYVGDLCHAAGVSERTLRNVFHTQFGMGPHRYLTLARLNSVRRAIRTARPGETIASICANFGIWDFGRFARQYQDLFGVLPSCYLSTNRTRTRSTRHSSAMRRLPGRLGEVRPGAINDATRRGMLHLGHQAAVGLIEPA